MLVVKEEDTTGFQSAKMWREGKMRMRERVIAEIEGNPVAPSLWISAALSVRHVLISV